MILSDLTLQSFRSHRQATFPFGPITLFTGNNGVGKTNILEAIWVLATTRSFQTNDDRDLITWGESATRITGGDWEVVVALEPKMQKKVAKFGVTSTIAHYLGSLRTVLFTPQSLELLLGSPSGRRKFLNHLLIQSRRDGAYLLSSYQQALRQRNSLLKQLAEPDSLDLWDETMAEFGSQLTLAREELIRRLEELIGPCFTPWNPRGYELAIRYRPSGETDPILYRERLKHLRPLDLRFRVTTSGPHRDDVDFLIDDRPASRFASRGEQRSLLLALLGAAVDYLTDGDTRPVLLLDDVFSELDGQHREALVDLTQRTQTVLTTTEAALTTLFDRSTTVHHPL